MLDNCLFKFFNGFQQQESILIPSWLDRACAVLYSAVPEDAQDF